MNSSTPSPNDPALPAQGFIDPQRIDWNLVKSFSVVADLGSLTRAAAVLGISQPTISRQITELEQLVGASLFERGARGLSLTQAGAALVEPSRRMLAAAQAVSVAAAGQNQEAAGTVRITASEVMSAYILPPLLAGLRERHPAIQIELVASNQVDNLLAREADIAIRHVQPEQGALIARKIGAFPIGFYAHRDYLHVPERRAAEGAGELERYDWIGLDQSSRVIDGFRQAGYVVDKTFFVFRCDSDIVGWQAVLAGLGVGISAHVIARQFPQLVRVLEKQPLPDLPVWITAHRELRDTARIRAVFDFLVEKLLALHEGAR
ncbi:MAG TPA: LysR family transcriptional regulator [Noviherbaspirillum sp.]|nr:LysR family transcriptional regulator [Noviherbaspirillum sp.]